MTYEEFQDYVRSKCMYETIYTDSDGREILVVKLLDAYSMLNRKAIAEEREAVLQTIEALYDTQDPNPMYKEGYNHALDNIEEFIKGRANATLS